MTHKKVKKHAVLSADGSFMKHGGFSWSFLDVLISNLLIRIRLRVNQSGSALKPMRFHKIAVEFRLNQHYELKCANAHPINMEPSPPNLIQRTVETFSNFKNF